MKLRTDLGLLASLAILCAPAVYAEEYSSDTARSDGSSFAASLETAALTTPVAPLLAAPPAPIVPQTSIAPVAPKQDVAVRPVWILAGAETGASVLKTDGVRTTLEKGSAIMAGDRIHVPGGSSIQISLDSSTLSDLVDIPGPADLEILDISPYRFFLRQGTIHFFLDKRAHSLEVYTRNSSASEGAPARFAVQSDGIGSVYRVFTGAVEIEGREPLTNAVRYHFGELSAGQALDVVEERTVAEVSRPMTFAERFQFMKAVDRAQATRNAFPTAAEAQTWLEQNQQAYATLETERDRSLERSAETEGSDSTQSVESSNRDTTILY